MTIAKDNDSSVMSAPRPAYFAFRVLRLFIKTASAQQCGTGGLALLTVIGMTEDARRYRGPVTFWNEQLLPLVGFAKWDRLDRARQLLINAGWLAYEPGGRHRPGRYRVMIPSDLQDVSDTAVDESSTPFEGYQAGDQSGVERGIKGDIKRESSGVSTGGTFLPVPEPIPSPIPKKQGAAFAADDDGDEVGVQEIEPPLLEWLQWWNRLKAESLVAAGVSETNPSQGVLKAWKRAKREKALLELLRDRDAIEREIQASQFCRNGWFCLEKLLGGKNKDGEFILNKLIDGAYRDAKSNGNGNREVDLFRGLKQFVADAEGST